MQIVDLLGSVLPKLILTVRTLAATHLYVEAELLQSFEQSIFIAGHKGLQVRVDS